MKKIALLGCGTIGSQVASELLNNRFPQLRLTKILVKNKNKYNKYQDIITDSFEEVLTSKPDIIIELMGNEHPALEYISTCLNAQIHVVTANKELIAKHANTLMDMAEKNNVMLRFEASVAGGIPIINTILSDLKSNSITDIVGILNGTTNYILTQMQSGMEFAEALAQAQSKGYAEPDPTNDIQGYDVKYKISILAGLAFKKYISPDLIRCMGIKNISQKDIKFARELDSTIKLLANAKIYDNNVIIDVFPTLIPNAEQLSSVNDVLNAVSVKTDLLGWLTLTGKGAGPMPTSSAVFSDILYICDSLQCKATSIYKNTLPVSILCQDKCKFYVRLEVNDQTGVIRDIGSVLADNNISIESIIQKNHNSQADLMLVTHEILFDDLQASIAKIKALTSVHEICSIMKVFNNK